MKTNFAEARLEAERKKQEKENEKVEHCVSLFKEAYNKHGNEWKEVIKNTSYDSIFVDYHLYRFFNQIRNEVFLGLKDFAYNFLWNCIELQRDKIKGEIKRMFGLSMTIRSSLGSNVVDYQNCFHFEFSHVKEPELENKEKPTIDDLGKLLSDKQAELKAKKESEEKEWLDSNRDFVARKTEEGIKLFDEACEKYGKTWEESMKTEEKPWKCVNSFLWYSENKAFSGLIPLFKHMEPLHYLVQKSIRNAIDEKYGLKVVITTRGFGKSLYLV